MHSQGPLHSPPCIDPYGSSSILRVYIRVLAAFGAVWKHRGPTGASSHSGMHAPSPTCDVNDGSYSGVIKGTEPLLYVTLIRDHIMTTGEADGAAELGRICCWDKRPGDGHGNALARTANIPLTPSLARAHHSSRSSRDYDLFFLTIVAE